MRQGGSIELFNQKHRRHTTKDKCLKHHRCEKINSPYARRLRIEQLEDRRLLAVLTVQNNLDDTLENLASDGELSLREAIEITNNPGTVIDGFSSNDLADEIQFASQLFDLPRTITLQNGELEVTEPLTIKGPGQDLLAIDAQQKSRVLNFTNRIGHYALDGLTVQHGFVENDKGGGIRFDSSGTLSLIGTTVSGNSTKGVAAAHGAGIWTSFGTVTLTSSTVSGNNAVGDFSNGGGIFALSGAVTLVDSIVTGNSTSGDSSSGGGIYALSYAVTLTNSTVNRNSSDYNGGGIVTVRGPLTLTNSMVSGNTAIGSSSGSIGGGGGGIFSFYGEVTINSSTISGNSSDVLGGGIHTRFGPATLFDSTVSGNMASELGGGVFARYLISITIHNSIVAGNTAMSAPDLRSHLDLTTFNVNYSLIGDATSGLTTLQLADITSGVGNLLNIDPLLGPLADNGGPTPTHALLPRSPAIDAGDPTIPFRATEFDQRGVGYSRVMFDRIDIGAYEAQLIPSADFDVDGDVDGIDFLAWQRGFGMEDAVRADGNSDDDTDIDASDLAAWSLTYGEAGVGPIAATQVIKPVSTRASLLDSILGAEVDIHFSNEADWPVAQPSHMPLTPARVRSVRDAVPVARRESYRDVEPLSEHSDVDPPWLSEELLERVFG